MLQRLAIALCLVAPLSYSWAWTGKCVGVSDGDTITVVHDGVAEQVRLYGVDAPEKRQAYGQRAKQFTSSLTFGNMLEVSPVTRDAYGRTVAKVRLPDGRRLAWLLLHAGLAWWYRAYAPGSAVLKQLEFSSWERRRGLWADSAPVPPWEYRHGRDASGVSPANSYRDRPPPAKPAQAKASDAGAPADVEAPAPATDSPNGVVYMTGGHCFHRLGCRWMQARPRAITRAEAIAIGRKPCSYCKP